MKHLKRSKSGTQVKSHGCLPDVKIGAIGQFRVPKTLTSKMRLGAQPFLWKWVLFAWESKMIFISKAEHLPSFWKRGLGGLGNGLVVLKVVHLAFVMELRGLHHLQPPTPTPSYPYLLTLKIQLRKTCENCTNSRKLCYEQCQNKMCTPFVKQLLVFLVGEKTQRVKRKCTIEYHQRKMKLKWSEIDYFTMSLLHFVLNSCYIMGGAGVTVILSPPTKTAMREGPT